MTMRSDWIWAQWKLSPPFAWLAPLSWEYDRIEDAGQADSESGDASRITPDPEGDTWTPEPARPEDAVRVAWNADHIMRRLYGTYSPQAQRMNAVFRALWAHSKLAVAI